MEEIKVYVTEWKSLAMVICYTAKTFRFLPGCFLCSQPLPTLLCGLPLSQVLCFAFHVIPFLQPAKVPLKSSTLTSPPKIQRVCSAPLPDSLIKTLNNVSSSTAPEDGTGSWPPAGLTSCISI